MVRYFREKPIVNPEVGPISGGLANKLSDLLVKVRGKFDMRLHSGLKLAALLIAVSCAPINPFDQTQLSQNRKAIFQGIAQEGLLVKLNRDIGFNSLLGDAAFEMVKGMDLERAIATLQADGAICAGSDNGSICLWKVTVREPLFPCGLPPISLISMCIRMPGPRRTTENNYQVGLLAPKIQKRSDIATHTFSRDLTVNE